MAPSYLATAPGRTWQTGRGGSGPFRKLGSLPSEKRPEVTHAPAQGAWAHRLEGGGRGATGSGLVPCPQKKAGSPDGPLRQASAGRPPRRWALTRHPLHPPQQMSAGHRAHG